MKTRCLTIVAIMVLVAVSCHDSTKEQQGKERQPVTVTVMRASSGESSSGMNYVGTAKASRSAVITAKYPGSVSRVNVSKGSVVKEGNVLAQLNSESVISTRDAAEATFRQAEDGLARVEKVRSTGGVSDVKYVEVKTQYDKALSALKAARKAVEDCTVKAPFCGVIDRMDVSAGEEVGIASPLMTIVDVSNPEIEISVPESEISSIVKGQIFIVSVPALGQDPFRARVTAGGAVASPLSHSYTCTLVPEEKVEGLLPGMACSASTSRMGSYDVVIPADVVRTDDHGRFVWCVEDGRACKKYIKVDGYASGGIKVSSGLEKDVLIVTAGARKISGGMKVNVIEDGGGL